MKSIRLHLFCWACLAASLVSCVEVPGYPPYGGGYGGGYGSGYGGGYGGGGYPRNYSGVYNQGYNEGYYKGSGSSSRKKQDPPTHCYCSHKSCGCKPGHSKSGCRCDNGAHRH